MESFYFRPIQLNWLTFGTITYLGLFSGAISMIGWVYGIKTLGPIRAGQFLHLIPAFTIVLAILVLGESLKNYHLIGIIFIVVGIYLASIRQR